MSSIKNIADINKSQETLLFKIFEPRTPSLMFPELTYDGDGGSDGLTDGSQGSPQLNFPSQSLSSSVFNFDQTAKPRSRVKPKDLLESSNPDMFQMKAAAVNLMEDYSTDPNLPKRLHVSNIPFRYR